jgi:acetyl-CoA acetyltransferase
VKRGSVAVVGAAETTDLGKIPDLSVIGLHADAALNAMADAGLRPADIDGVATAGISAEELAYYLGITPTWADGTNVGGCSFMLHVRHAAAAINEGLARTILITHGESGRSRVGAVPLARSAASLRGQFEAPYGAAGPPTMFTVPVLRYLKAYGLNEEDLAWVPVIQREWAARNPRASFRDPITVDDVLGSPVIAWPFRKLMCCLVTDGGGALILTAAEGAADFPRKPVYILGTGESTAAPLISQMEDFTSSRAFKVSGRKAFAEAGISHADVDHLMIYDAFAHLPLYGLEDLGFCKPGEAAGFIRDRNTAPPGPDGRSGQLPLNTNGGGLSYMHSGMYGMYALQESVRQLRGIAAAQVPGTRVSVCHGVGGWFAAAGTIVFSNEI